MRRPLPGGLELDDDRSRVDLAAVHDYLSNESYWARGRRREAVERTEREAVDHGPHANLRWSLAIQDAHGLYERFGFGPPDDRFLARDPRP